MAFTYMNARGVTYTLHARTRALSSGKQHRLFFFARGEREGALDGVPDGYAVFETQSGLPMLRLHEGASPGRGVTGAADLGSEVSDREEKGKNEKKGSKKGASKKNRQAAKEEPAKTEGKKSQRRAAEKDNKGGKKGRSKKQRRAKQKRGKKKGR